MTKNELPKLSQADIDAGIRLVEIPLKELEVVDVSDKNVEKIARGYILGSKAIGRRKEVRQQLEERVIKRIGRKGKHLTDKLFELIEGVYIISKDDKKGIKYYQVPPNLQAIIYALDRVLGKPAVKSKDSEERKGIMVVESIIRNLAGGGSIEEKKSIEIKN
jgi:hypothetical protein